MFKNQLFLPICRVLNSLGQKNVPVYTGSNVGSERIKVANYEFSFKLQFGVSGLSKKVITKSSNPYSDILSDGKAHILIINSAMTDLADFLSNYYNPSKHKIARIVMQGGYEVKSGKVVPNLAANNVFDMKSAQIAFNLIQAHQIPFYICTRDFAYSYPFDVDSYASLGNHPVPRYLNQIKNDAIANLYRLCLYRANNSRREGFPNDRNVEWFFEYILKIPQPAQLPAINQIHKSLTSLNGYDVFSTLFAIYPEKFGVQQISSSIFECKPITGFNYQKWIISIANSNLK